jgi:hypothetical protein
MDSHIAQIAPPSPPPSASLSLGQRLLALDDVISQLGRHMRCESTIPSGLRSSLHELLLRSEAARLAVLISGPASSLRRDVEALSAAADQALLRARRSGRASRDLLHILAILSQGLHGLLAAHAADQGSSKTRRPVS